MKKIALGSILAFLLTIVIQLLGNTVIPLSKITLTINEYLGIIAFVASFMFLILWLAETSKKGLVVITSIIGLLFLYILIYSSNKVSLLERSLTQTQEKVNSLQERLENCN